MLVSILLGILGIVCIILGYLIWKKEKITLLHDYHYDKVSEADKKIFCALSGWGTISVGLGIFLTGLILGLTESLLGFIPFVVGMIVGLALFITAGIKYNK